MKLNPSSSRLLGKLLLAFGLAVISVVSIVGIFLAKPAIIVAVIGGAFFALLFSFSGNPRLFCLWGLFITAPIDLDISFMVIAHMGGAGAFTIDLVDFFLAPLVLFLARDFYRGHRHQFRLSRVTLFWGLLILLGIYAIVIGPLRTVSAHEVFRMLKLLVLFLVVINEVVRIRQIKQMIAALMVGVALQCVIGLIQYIFDANLGAQIIGEQTQDLAEWTSKATYLEAEFTYRIGALLGHPNLLGAYLALLLPLGIAMLFTRISPYAKIPLTITVMMGLVVLILTLSRAGWISFAFAFVVMLVFSFLHPAARPKFLFGRVAMIGGMVSVAMLLAGPILKRLFQSDPGAVNFRFDWMLVAWEMVKAKPILGFGLNTFVFHAPPYSPFGTPHAVMDAFAGDLPVVHNIFLIVWSEQGTVGLLIFLAMHAYLVMLAWRNAKHFKPDVLYMANAGCIAGILAILVDGLASFFIRNDAPARAFFLVVGLLVAIYYWHRDNNSHTKTA